MGGGTRQTGAPANCLRAIAHRRQPPGTSGDGASFGANRSSGHCHRRERYVQQWSNIQLLKSHAPRPASLCALHRLYQVQGAPGRAIQMYGEQVGT